MKFDLADFIRSQLKFNSQGKCINAFQILTSPEILRRAYETIKSKPGNMTEGADQETLDGISDPWIAKTSTDLIHETYRPRPARRVYIPKPNGKKRPLGISSPRDKVIQQAMKLVLEIVLEPKFSNCSHGFRPGRGCHTALREIREWKGVSWFVEGDIKGFFDNIDHNLLSGLLDRHFDEPRLRHLYWKFVKAGYIEFDMTREVFVATDKGVPQGGIISPLLSNLILHELDRHMENLSEEYERKSEGQKPYFKSMDYHKLTMAISRSRKKISKLKLTNSNFDSLRASCKTLIKLRRRIKSLIHNPEFVKIRYVRYADDWLVGVWGSKAVAKDVKLQAQQLLETLKLELSIEKTLITNARAGRAKFLGTFIKIMASNKFTLLRGSKNNNARKRIQVGNLWMTAPILEIVKKLESKGFLLRRGNRWLPKSIGTFTALPIRDIIIRYLAIISGITNYYSFTDNKLRLNKIHWILKESLRKTISRKLKCNRRKFLHSFGRNITLTIKRKDKVEKKLSFQSPDLKRTPMLFLGAASFKDPYTIVHRWIRTKSSFGQACANCNSWDNIEMHHVKHIRTINLKLNSFDQLLARVNRKQVPLCRRCHADVHAGKYSGMSLKHFNG